MMEHNNRLAWQEIGDACHFAKSLDEVAFEIKAQAIVDRGAFALHYHPLSFTTATDLADAIQLLLPGSSFSVGYTSRDHQDGEEAPEGWWAALHLGYEFETGMPEDGVWVNGRPDMGLALAEVFCMAAGYAVEAHMERTSA